ncbi:MAG TPA: hypothetical protein VGA13_02745 [Acidimicrobiales bacterium]
MRRRRRSRSPAAVAALAMMAVAALLPAPSISYAGSPLPAAQSSDGARTLEITPARVESDIFATEVQTTVRVGNRGESTLEIEIGVRGLGHDRAGGPLLDAVPVPDGATVTPTIVTLGPGESVDVTLTGPVPVGRGLYAAVTAGHRTANAVTSRVAAIVLVRGRQPWRTGIAPVEVFVTPTDDDRWLVEAVVLNTGDVHVLAGGDVELVTGDGRSLGAVTLDRAKVIPGFERALVGSVPAVEGVDPTSLTALVRPQWWTTPDGSGAPLAGDETRHPVQAGQLQAGAVAGDGPLGAVGSVDDPDGATGTLESIGNGADSDDDDGSSLLLPVALAGVAVALAGVAVALVVGRRTRRDEQPS